MEKTGVVKAFLLISVLAILVWVVLWVSTDSHEVATTLFTALAFTVAATALYLQQRSIAQTQAEVTRMADALKESQRLQAIQAAFLEHSARINKVNVKANASPSSLVRKDVIKNGFSDGMPPITWAERYVSAALQTAAR